MTSTNKTNTPNQTSEDRRQCVHAIDEATQKLLRLAKAISTLARAADERNERESANALRVLKVDVMRLASSTERIASTISKATPPETTPNAEPLKIGPPSLTERPPESSGLRKLLG